jgi:adenine-specific DNA-methyltransferase
MNALTQAVAAAAERNAVVDAEDKKRWGQFFTGPEVAEFMGSLVDGSGSQAVGVRVLDPGAGVGILGIAAARHLLSVGEARVHLVAVEAEPAARQALARTLAHIAGEAEGRLTYEVIGSDFLDMAQPTLGVPTLAPFDFVISNPPYFKLSPTETRGGDAPNIYARFMEIGARLLRPGGQLVFIVPRSFASGLYFKRFRKAFHATMSLERVHIFDSRRDAFRDQGVLQENIIVHYRKQRRRQGAVVVSTSCGAHDLATRREQPVPYDILLHPNDPLGVLHLPASAEELALLRSCNAWPSSLHDYGLEISTGPVVPFRATDEMIDTPNGEAVVPLLWMHHVRADGVRWPIGNGFRKPEYIRAAAPEKLLVRNETYVLLRRFSAKEEERRLTAAVLHRGALPGHLVGLENHLNFVHRPGGVLDTHEAVGFAALLNSRLLDNYFRVVNGNTQVNATEIRAMSLPPRELVIEIGRRLARAPERAVDDVVEEVLGVEGGRSPVDPECVGDAHAAAERERRVHLASDGGCGAGHPLV